MEQFESQQFRDELAEELKQAPKEERGGVLGKAKENPDYWQARTEKIGEHQNEEEVDDGFGVFVKKKTLYHGSGVSGIRTFNEAEEDTVGSGVYFTSEAKDAIGYARRRAGRQKDANPVIYEASVENMKLLDLRKDENVKKILESFKPRLVEMKSNFSTKTNDKNARPGDVMKWMTAEEILKRAIEKIDSGKIHSGNVREIAFSLGHEFSDHIKSLGYEGLITFEGGEGDSVGNHDTYLIFEPEKVKINQEHEVSKS